MVFARKKVWLAARIGVALSVVIAFLVGGLVYSDEAEKASAAQRMLAVGVTVKALPTSARASSTKGRRSSSTTYTIHYEFRDAQMRHVEGWDVATQSEFDALIDPNNSSVIRRDATVDVVYDRANPSKNGLKSRFESASSPDFFAIGGISAVVLFFALLIAGYVYSFMKKRIAPEVAVESAPVWRPPRA